MINDFSMMPMTKNKRWLTAEKTPSYFTDPRVPKRIKEAFPNKKFKLIFLLCEPGRRAYSDYKFVHRTNMQNKPDHPRHQTVKERFWTWILNFYWKALFKSIDSNSKVSATLRITIWTWFNRPMSRTHCISWSKIICAKTPALKCFQTVCIVFI